MAQFRFKPVLFLLFLCFLTVTAALGQDKPYFVTYSHDLEEPGNLEIETKTALARPDSAGRYGATAFEFEYGTRAWWTTELYLDGQTTGGDSTLFTGFRIENRLRPLMREHFINPVLYVEYENISGCRQDHPRSRRPRWPGRLGRPQRRGPPRARPRRRTEADPLLQPEELEHLRKLHRRKESGSRAVGIRLRGGRNPAPQDPLQRPRMHVLRRKILGWRGSLRRPGRHRIRLLSTTPPTTSPRCSAGSSPAACGLASLPVSASLRRASAGFTAPAWHGNCPRSAPGSAPRKAGSDETASTSWPATLLALAGAVCHHGCRLKRAVGPHPRQGSHPSNPLSGKPEAITAGALLYHNHCQQCHLAEGQATDTRSRP